MVYVRFRSVAAWMTEGCSCRSPTNAARTTGTTYSSDRPRQKVSHQRRNGRTLARPAPPAMMVGREVFGQASRSPMKVYQSQPDVMDTSTTLYRPAVADEQ
jgi:hypothetical protein